MNEDVYENGTYTLLRSSSMGNLGSCYFWIKPKFIYKTISLFVEFEISQSCDCEIMTVIK